MSTDQPERLDLASAVPTDERLDLLRSAFPEVFREGKVDVDALRRSLGDWVDPGPERFGLSWPGKAECMRVIQEPSIGTLVPMSEESVDWDTTQNVIIEGENLEVLKLLQKAYYGRVKLIYIDPPYNTGKEFIYPDNFREGLADYLRYSGQVDEEGFKLSANAETDGRYHSKWLSMMYPRLFLARNLLRDDGVIFVSIDDHEVHNLRALMNEIFGEENFVATFVWVSNLKGRQISDSGPARTHEYILCFARNSEAIEQFRGSSSAFQKLMPTVYRSASYEVKHDAKGPYVTKNELYNTNSKFNEQTAPTMVFRIHYNPDTEEVRVTDIDDPRTLPGFVTAMPHANSRPGISWHAWRWSRSKILAESDHLEFDVSNGALRIRTKIRDVEGMTMKDIIIGPSTVTGQADLEALEMQRLFDNPKPVSLLQTLLSVTTYADDLVMDFFGGSGTTAEAVYRQNFEDGAQRSFVLVQFPEPIGSEGSGRTLAALMKERVATAGAAVAAAQPPLGSSSPDTGHRSYRLGWSNYTVWDSEITDVGALQEQLAMSVDHMVEGAAEQSMLTELLLKAGYPLTLPVEEVDFAGVPGYSVAEGALLVCLSKELSIETFEAMVEREPAMILVLDAGFGGSDELKVNALQTVRARNQQSGSDIALRVV